MAVRLQKLAALGPRAHFAQHFFIEAARTVARVHHHMQPKQGASHVGIQAAAHAIHQLLLVYGQEVALLHRGMRAVHRRGVGRDGQDHADIGGRYAALGQEKFEPVAVVGMVRGRHHDGGVGLEALGQQAHIHGGRGAHAIVPHLRARASHALGAGGQQRGAGQAGIPPDGNGQRAGMLAGLFA